MKYACGLALCGGRPHAGPRSAQDAPASRTVKVGRGFIVNSHWCCAVLRCARRPRLIGRAPAETGLIAESRRAG